MSGRALGVMDSQGACKYVNIPYDANTVTQAHFVCQFPCRLVAINGRPRVAGSGGACTFVPWKAPSGVAAASGTALQPAGATAFNVAGTADINQSLTLVGDATVRTFNVGDSFNLVLSGTPTSAVGIITAVFDPL